MYKLIMLIILLLLQISSELYGQDIDTVYIVVDMNSQEYSIKIDRQLSNILITTKTSKKRYEELIKKQSESRYLVLSSEESGLKPYYRYHIKSSPDSILTISEYANFESKKKNILSFIEYEKPENMNLFLRSIRYFVVKNLDSKNIYFYFIYYMF